MSEEKKIDNRIKNPNEVDNKVKLKEVNEQIDVQKRRLKKLDDIEELFVSLNSNISKCVDLLAKSIKGQNINKKLNYIEESNKINFNKSMDSIYNDKEEVMESLKKLNEEKDNYQERIRKENNSTIEKEQHKEDKKEGGKNGIY